MEFEPKTPTFLIPNQMAFLHIVLFVHLYIYSGINKCKHNVSRPCTEHLLSCDEINSSDRSNMYFHPISYHLHINIELWHLLQLVMKSVSVKVTWSTRAKFTAEARHTLPTVNLNKENFDTCNKGKPFHELLLYWNLAQQMQFKWKGNFCCCL